MLHWASNVPSDVRWRHRSPFLFKAACEPFEMTCGCSRGGIDVDKNIFDSICGDPILVVLSLSNRSGSDGDLCSWREKEPRANKEKSSREPLPTL